MRNRSPIHMPGPVQNSTACGQKRTALVRLAAPGEIVTCKKCNEKWMGSTKGAK